MFGGVYAMNYPLRQILQWMPLMKRIKGYVRTTIHTGLAGALLYEHFHPVDFNTSAFTAYGAFAGNCWVLVYHLSSMQNRYTYHGSYHMGRTGWNNRRYKHSNKMNFERKDWIFNAVGVPASMAIFALSDILEGYNMLTSDQEEGLMATGIGSSVLGLSYLSTKYQIDTSDSLFAGSSMAWGAYYGGLLPLALGIDDRLETHEQILFSLVSSDIFLATSCIAMKRGYESQKSFFPQITAITGGTLASLGTFLFTDQSQPFRCRLGGATLGFVVEINYNKRDIHFQLPKIENENLFPYNWP